MKLILNIVGVLLFVAAIAGGLYVGGYLCLVGGIIQIVEACKHTPVEASGIAWGVVRVVCTSIAGWGTFFLGALISGTFFAAGSSRRRF